MATALDIITDAARECGVAAGDIPLEADVFDTGLRRLNMMLRALPNDAVTIWKQSSGSIAITADTQSYTIAERPLTLETVNYKDGVETWLYEMSRDEYFELPDKASSGRPSQFYYHRQRDVGVLSVWPVLATATGTIEWQGRTSIAAASAAADVIDIPVEWEEAVHYGMAYRMASAFDVTARMPDLMASAERSLRDAKGADAEGSVYFEAEC